MFLGLVTFSQTQTVSGVVLGDEEGLPLPGVTVYVMGTTNGTTTNFDGEFQLEISESVDSISFSFIGYVTQTAAHADGVLNIRLKPDVEMLKEVVVTALGIPKEKKALGYAATDVEVDDMSTARDPNLMNTISGKVAGVQVSKTTGGPGASNRVVIRGAKSLTGNNQPLFVVDGIPIDNTTFGTGEQWGGVDYGSPISDLNPDDIESMTVLKGANAAALYGSRAANGVIIITTKRGKAGKGLGVSFTSSSTIETPDFQKKFQNIYGAGSNGQFEYQDGVPFFNTALLAKSWGPKMEGQTYTDWDGETRTYSPQPDNYKNFFQTGYTLTNSLAIDGGSDKNTFRLSYTNLTNRATVPNSSFSRHNFSVAGTSKLSAKLIADAKVGYTRQDAFNRLNQSDGRGAARNYNFMPRNVSDESLRDYEDATGMEKVWYSPWAWQSNPYWQMYENSNKDYRDRFMGAMSVKYKLADWLLIMGRTGMDTYIERREGIVASGSFANPAGEIWQRWLANTEVNTDILVSAQRKLTKNWALDANLGGNRMSRRFETTYIRNSRLAIPDFYQVENVDGGNLEYDNFLSRKKVNSIYGSAQVSFKNWLYLEFTARNDWTSTLANDNNSYFYPSVSTSFVWTDALKDKKKWLSFGKLRTSYALVGADDAPYLISQTYSPASGIGDFNGEPRWVLTQPLAYPALKPERSTSVEIGHDLYLFTDRIGVDVTWYQINSFDQIIPNFPVSGASGFTTAVLNGGEIRNRGIELLVTGTPIDKENFGWTTSVNFTKNKSTVLSLPEGVDSHPLGEQWGVVVSAVPGQPYGVITGTGIEQDGNGNYVMYVDPSTGKPNGLYDYDKAQQQKVLGNYQPDFMMGVSNNFRYKKWEMSFLVDIRKGGDIYSASNMYAHGYSGTVEQTIEGREEWYESERQREAAGVAPEDWKPTGGYLAPGVYAEGTIIDGVDVSGQENQTYSNPELYWGQFSNWTKEIHEPHVYDASFVKLRELSITYVFASKFSEKLKIGSASMSLVGRNLWLIHSNVPNIDPEAAYSNGNGQGIEYATFPINRSIGVTFKVKL